jgi:hypothetical protein
MALIDNLISYWKLDESSGNAADSHGSNNLTNTNTVTYSAAKINNGANFVDTSSQKLTITDASQTGLDITGALTISFWFKRPTTGKYTDINKWSQAGGEHQCSYQVDLYSDNTLYFQVSSSGYVDAGRAYWASNSTFTETSNWHFLVCTYVPSTSMIVYLDGDVWEGTVNGTIPASIFNSSTDFKIGFLPLGTDLYDTSSFDEVGIWNRALSSTEVTELYNGGDGLAYPFEAAGPTNLKTYNTNLKANIKSINTNLIANIKSLDTNA